MSTFLIDVDKSVMLPHPLMNIVSGTPDVWDFINNGPRNVFFYMGEDKIPLFIGTNLLFFMSFTCFYAVNYKFYKKKYVHFP